jgi:signal transduction histidine kinase
MSYDFSRFMNDLTTSSSYSTPVVVSPFKGDLVSSNGTNPTASRSRRKFTAAVLCLIGTFIIGDIDYLTGYRITLLILYLLPVGFAAVYVGPIFAVVLAVLSVVISVCTDFWSGMPVSELNILALNASMVLAVFIIVIGVLHAMNRIFLRLEWSVEQKTQDLLKEMSERGRMEREIIDLSEREQRRFGQELHDVVCQDLASLTIAAHMLKRKLVSVDHAETALARELAHMADRALETTRSVARGFFTAGFDGAGLAEALREIGRRTEEQSNIQCVVRWQKDLTISDEDTVINLFRIAQEAIHNVVKHASASSIKVNVVRGETMLRLTIEDDGQGLPAKNGKDKGLGLRIMAYRAGLIGGEFKMEPGADGGTLVSCEVPVSKLKTHRVGA